MSLENIASEVLGISNEELDTIHVKHQERLKKQKEKRLMVKKAKEYANKQIMSGCLGPNNIFINFMIFNKGETK